MPVPSSPHRVLVLGAGLVSRPIVRFLLDQEDVRLTVASLLLPDAERLIAGHARGRAIAVDATNPEKVEPLVADSDLVVSLVPYVYHVAVARLALKHRAHVVTTSYVSPEMRALDAEARAVGVALLNEIGLDPGIDHMSAVRLLSRVKARGARVEGFVSCCGSLPDPDAAMTNPWGYKFAWSPRGAFLAARQPARWLEGGVTREVPASELFAQGRAYPVEGLGTLEMYPNRDSLHYVDSYGLAGAGTVLRGTLRWPGWCVTLSALGRLGLLDPEPREWPAGSWADRIGALLPHGSGGVRERAAAFLGLRTADPVLDRLAFVGLFDEAPLPARNTSPLDALVEACEPRLAYAPGERDMVVLRHEVLARESSDNLTRTVSLLVARGEPGGDSATARTVSLPAALGVRRILDGKLTRRGVLVPTDPEIGEPVLDALEGLGLGFAERTTPADPSVPLLGPN